MSAAAALVRLHTKVGRTVTVVGQVVRKYPRHTVPQRYLPFYDLRETGSLSLQAGTEVSNDIIVHLRRSLSGSTHNSVRIPEAWLSMQESQLTALVRREYWASRRRQSRIAAHQAEIDLDRARQNLLSAQAELDRRERAAAAARAAIRS